MPYTDLVISFQDVSASKPNTNISASTPIASVNAIAATPKVRVNMTGTNVGPPAIRGGYIRSKSEYFAYSTILLKEYINSKSSSVSPTITIFLKQSDTSKFSSVFIDSEYNTKSIDTLKVNNVYILSSISKNIVVSPFLLSVLPVSSPILDTYINRYSSINSLSSIDSFLLQKLLNSAAYPTDDVFGDANIDDDQTAWVDKNLRDNLLVALVTTVNINKPLVNTVTANSISYINPILPKDSIINTSSNSILSINLNKYSYYSGISEITNKEVEVQYFNVSSSIDTASGLAQNYFQDLTYVDSQDYVGTTLILT